MPKSCRNVVAVAALFVTNAMVAAQTGPTLLLDPFRRDDQIEINSEWLIGTPTTTNNGFDFRIDQIRFEGRVRLTPGESDEGLARAQPRAGYALTAFQLDSDDPNVPRRIGDGSVGVGMGILAVDGWLGGVTVGIGYASASGGGDEAANDVAPFLPEDGNAPYAQANFAVGKTFESGDSFGLVLSFDGNRTILPDVPLPGFQYRRELNDNFSLAVGFPFSGFEWEPTDRLSIDIQLALPSAVSGSIEYDIARVWDRPLELYGSISSRTVAASWDELRAGDRVFFSQNLAEVGLAIEPGKTIEEFRFVLAGGWAFDRRIEEGWDTRDVDLLAEIDDGAYVRAAFELKL